MRWTLPRFRYDQLQKLGWQILLPLSLLNIFVTSAVVVALSLKRNSMSAKIKIIERQGASFSERLYLVEIFKGMRVTFGHFLRNLLDNSKLYVRHYPEVKPEITPRWRGRHRLTTHEDGTVKCVACFMCQTNCPSHCIIDQGGRTGRRQVGKDARQFRYRPSRMHLLRLLRRGLSDGCDPHGHRHILRRNGRP